MMSKVTPVRKPMEHIGLTGLADSFCADRFIPKPNNKTPKTNQMQLLSDIFESVLKLIHLYNAGLWGKVCVLKKIFLYTTIFGNNMRLSEDMVVACRSQKIIKCFIKKTLET